MEAKKQQKCVFYDYKNKKMDKPCRVGTYWKNKKF